MIQRYRNPSK